MAHPLEQFRPAFWSYDLGEIDIRRDKEIIITQLLNYGDWAAVRWLYRTYGEAEIKKVVSTLRRGVWFERTLNFWVQMLGVKIEPALYQRAVRRVG